MKNYLRLFACLLLLVVARIGTAEEKVPEMADFAFLNGFWVGSGFGGVSEEMWMPASSGSMQGIFKQSSDDGVVFTEYMEITEVDGAFALRLKHFNPDFSGWEEKADYVTFPLRSVAPNQAVFGGLTYTVVADTLRVELRLRESDGSVNTEVFEMTRRAL